MNAPGEIARLTDIAAPDVGLITNVGPAHLEGLGTHRRRRRRQGRAVRTACGRTARSRSTWTTNGWCARPRTFRGRRIEFGAGREVSMPARWSTAASMGSPSRLGIGARTAPVRLRMAGRHNVQNALAAAAVGHGLGIEIEAIAAGLGAPPAAQMRMQVVRLANGVTVVNDGYNANPASIEAALDCHLAAPPAAPIAVLGEMRELGAQSAALHRQVGAYAARCGVRWLLAVGPQGDDIAAGARAAGADLAVTRVRRRRRRGGVADRRAGSSGDAVLVKGSRGPDDDRRRAPLRRAHGRGGGAAGRGGGPRLMLYHLLYPLHTTYSAFNVFRYITFRALLAALTALPDLVPASAPG